MTSELVLNDWNPSEATLRRWAFDENLQLVDQDEDLVLHSKEYLPVLLGLASDPSCPKAAYILACLDFYLMFLVLRGSEEELPVVREAVHLAMSATATEVVEWGSLQRRRLEYRDGLGPTTREQALLMGEELMNGVSRKATISLVGETDRTWEVELSVPPFNRHKERLSINKANGKFTFSR